MCLAPLPVVEAKLGVLVPINGMGLFVLQPEEFQRDAFSAQLQIHGDPVRIWSAPWAALMPLVKEPLQVPIIQLCRQRPPQFGRCGAMQNIVHGAVAYSQTVGDGAHAESERPLKT